MAKVLDIKWEGLDAVEIRLKNLAKASPQIALEALIETADEVLVPGIKQHLLNEKIVYREKILKSIGVRLAAGNLPAIDLGALDVPYAIDVEQGQPPGAPQNWQRWVAYARIKLGLSGKLAERVGGLLRNAAVKYGTKAHPFITPVMDERAAIFRERYFAKVRAKMRLNP